MKKIIASVWFALMLMCALCFGVGALEPSGQCGDNVYWNYNITTEEVIISGTGDMWDYGFEDVSPFDGDYNINNIKRVIIKNGVTGIGNNAFLHCSGLKDVKIPDSIIKIGKSAFGGCGNLEKIMIPNSVRYIGESAFNACTMLTDITIGNGVKCIEGSTFRFCENLKSITIPNNIISIGDSAFIHCKRLTNITIPDSVTSIGLCAFMYCESLKSVEIPGSVKTIGDSAFYQCENLVDVIINEGVTVIDEGAFAGCKIESIYIPKSVVEIGEYALGYDLWCDRNTSFKILSAKGTTAEKYAKDNSFAFEEYTMTHSHSYTSKTTKSATCGSAGVKTFTCSCGDGYTEAIIATGKHSYSNACDKECNVCKAKRGVPAHKYDNNCDAYCNVCSAKRSISHSYKASTTRATLSKNGKTVTKCTVCGAVKSTSAIYYPKSIKLSATTYTYNGKTKTPSVIVKDSNGKTLKNGTDYTVIYPKKRKSIGKYTVTVTFKGKYSGTKKLTFEIVPAKAKLSKVTAGSKQLTAAWNTVSGVTGYEVVYSTSKNFTKKTTKTATIKKAKTKKTTIKKLKKGKKYYVKVRAYKTVSGKKIYGAYSAVKNIKIK